MSNELEAKTRAAIIGVSRSEAEFLRLPAVESDVREMKKILESDSSDFDANEVDVLTDQEASRTQVIEALHRVFSQAEANESLGAFSIVIRARGALSVRLLAFHLRSLRVAATGERLTRREPNVSYLPPLRSRSPISVRD
jgi:hypothetical protein